MYVIKIILIFLICNLNSFLSKEHASDARFLFSLTKNLKNSYFTNVEIVMTEKTFSFEDNLTKIIKASLFQEYNYFTSLSKIQINSRRIKYFQKSQCTTYH